MTFELTAMTEPGRRLVALAEELATEIATCAGAHDREGSYPFESFQAIKRSGYFTAPVPEELGGLGVGSVHDLVVASSRLARGDAAVAIGVSMHVDAVLGLLRNWHAAAASGDTRHEASLAALLRAVAEDGVVMTSAISERNGDLTRPATTATRTPAGWRINGEKIFCTMSPAATVLVTAVGFVDDAGAERHGFALVPVDAPGVVVHDDWDALGMRASGSQTVTFAHVELPATALHGGFPSGDAVAYMARTLPAGLFPAATSLGIAEAATRTVLTETPHGATPSQAHARLLAADNVIGLSAARAVLARTAALVDEHYAASPASQGRDEELAALYAEVQAAKTFTDEAARRIVDGALALSGNAGHMNGHPLGRAYRDVLAGAFLHPLGASRAYELMSQVALGLEPTLS